MLRLKNILCAEGIVRDANSNIITAYNIIEEFQAVALPAFLHKLSVFGLFERDTLEGDEMLVELKLFINEENIHNLNLNFNFQGKSRFRAIVNLEGIMLSKPGKFSVVFVKDNSELGRYEIDIIYIGKPKNGVLDLNSIQVPPEK